MRSQFALMFSLMSWACSACNNNNVEYQATENVPILPPTSESIIYVSTATQNGFELYLTHNARESFLLTWGGFSVAPSWSPDKKWVVYERGMASGKIEIWKMKYDGGNKKRLTSPDLDSQSPRWSPDGFRIVFHQQRSERKDIFVIDSSGSNIQQITNPAIIPFWKDATFAFADWSGDGKSIVFAYHRRDIPQDNSSLGIISLETNSFFPLSSLDSLQPYFPRWSPTRNEIAFVGRSPSSNKGAQVFRVHSNGTNVQQLSDGFAAGEPDWSPDGNKIIYTRKANSIGDPSEIWRINRDGSDNRRVLFNLNYSVTYGNW